MPCQEATLPPALGRKAPGFRQFTNLISLGARDKVSSPRTSSGGPRRQRGDPLTSSGTAPAPWLQGLQGSGRLPPRMLGYFRSLPDRGRRRTDHDHHCPLLAHSPHAGCLLVPSRHRGSGCVAVFLWSECWFDRPSSGSCCLVSQRCFTPQRLRRWPRAPATLLLRRTEQGDATVAVTSVSLAYCGSLRALLPLDPDRGYLDLCPDPLWLLPDPQS